MRTVSLPSRSDGGGKDIRYVMVDDRDGLLWMINSGCIDVHHPYARAQSFDSPDFVLFDLDPSPGFTLAQTGKVALMVRSALEVLGLRAVVKTSSDAGMHLAVPLRPGHTYPRRGPSCSSSRRRSSARTPISSRPSGTRAAAAAC